MSWSTLFCFSKPTVFPLGATEPLSSVGGPLQVAQQSDESINGGSDSDILAFNSENIFSFFFRLEEQRLRDVMLQVVEPNLTYQSNLWCQCNAGIMDWFLADQLYSDGMTMLKIGFQKQFPVFYPDPFIKSCRISTEILCFGKKEKFHFWTRKKQV